MWHSRSVFISSTFTDMQAERDYLRTHVFPELEERLRARRCYLAWVDLRLGVAASAATDEGAREAELLKHCLAEVRRCRPFLVGLLGDRYGWIPPADRILLAGFGRDAIGRSVTDLEIDLGVLSDREQQSRSLFYFREPLPYAQMPPQTVALYSDGFSTEPRANDSMHALVALKRRIESTLPGRVHHYAAHWDGQRQRVTDLESFGRRVLDDLWAELAEETAASASVAGISWQQAERNSLEDFVEDRTRGFVGRKAILARLIELCQSPGRDGAAWGICVTGDPGAGKSALFGEVIRRLGQAGMLVLAHAAGASPLAASADAMLRRWIDELTTALNLPQRDAAENLDIESLATTFASLLGQLANRQRVVLLVDGLDQFEATTSARFVTWLPRLWPSQTRFVATANAGTASSALAERPGVEVLPLPPLDAAEARSIVEEICNRYHRTFEPRVVDALIAKTEGGAPAWGNPLWLVLAVEDLNLLDADDFGRAQQDYSGAPLDRLRELMIDQIANFPTDIPGLYDYTFNRAERSFGGALVRSFIGLIAVSRTGWREIDFRMLLPLASREAWDELKFAQLRRMFRGQLRQRGVGERWDFNHGQMRAAARRRLAAHNISERPLHALIASRLLSCPPDDPLRLSETMIHLLGSEDYDRASRYYGDRSLSAPELRGATRALADAVLAPSTGASLSVAEQICRLVKTADAASAADAAERLVFELEPALRHTAPLDVRLLIEQSVRDLFHRRVGAKEPATARDYHALWAACVEIGQIEAAQGHLPEALEAFGQGLAVAEQVAQADPDTEAWQRDLAVSYDHMGDTAMARGQLADVLRLSAKSLAIKERLARAHPGEGGPQNDLAISHLKLGTLSTARGDLAFALRSFRKSFEIFAALVASDPANTSWQRHLSTSMVGVGDVLVLQGNLNGALESFAGARAIMERLIGANPADSGWQRDLSICHDRIASALVSQGNLQEALKSYQLAHAIRERLARADPGSALYQRDLWVSFSNIGNVLMAQEDLAGALASYERSLAIATRLVGLDQGNASYQRDLAGSYEGIGDLRAAQNDAAGALRSYRESLAVRQQLVHSDPTSATGRRDLISTYTRIGQMEQAQGQLPAALQTFRHAQEIATELAKLDPSNANWQEALASSHRMLGNVQEAQGDIDGALGSYTANRDLIDELAKSDRSNAQRRLLLSKAHQSIGDLQFLVGDADRALSSYQAGLSIAKALVLSDPSNASWRSHLAASYDRLGDVLMIQGHLQQALESFQACAATDRIALADSADTPARRDLSVMLNKIGSVLERQGNWAEALKRYEQSLANMQRLVSADRDNKQWQRDLAVAHAHVGDARQGQGDVAGATQSQRSAVAILEWLCQSDPSNAGWRRDLSLCYGSLCELLLRQGCLSDALACAEANVAVQRQLAESRPTDPRRQHAVSVACGKLAEVLRRSGRSGEALAILRQAHAATSDLAQLSPQDSGWKNDLAWLEREIEALARQDEHPVVIQGDDGALHSCRPLNVFVFEGREYILFVEMPPHPAAETEPPSLILMRLVERDGTTVFQVIDSDDELRRVIDHIGKLDPSPIRAEP